MSPQPRVTTHSAVEGDGGDEGGSGEVVVGASVVSGGDASPVLDAAEHAFDTVTTFVGEPIEGDWPGASSAGWDDRLDLVLGEKLPDRVGIIGLVAEQAARRADGGE